LLMACGKRRVEELVAPGYIEGAGNGRFGPESGSKGGKGRQW
jgi:hypothetical protein